MAWPNAYTVNFCPNPRFENDLSGCNAYGGASIYHDPGARRSGSHSLWCHTPGDNPGEGVVLAQGQVELTGQGCASFYLVAHDVDDFGTLNVVCQDVTANTTLASTTIDFDASTGSWQRVVLNNLAFVSGHYITVYLETPHKQRCDFNVDWCQWEPQWSYNDHDTPTDYCDGSFTFGNWDGSEDASLSFKLYPFMISGQGNLATIGNGSLLNIGEIFYLVFSDPASGPAIDMGWVDLSGVPFLSPTGIRVGGGTVNEAGFNYVLMVAGLTDFATFLPGDVDPAISLVGYNNAGVATGEATVGNAGYSRPYATFSAPQVFQGSTAFNVWNQAAYFAVGYEIGSIGVNENQSITHVQAELVPNSGSPTVPTPYVRPRSLIATLAPTEMNYITNPSFEDSTVNWTAIFGTTMTQVNTHAWTGTYSAEMTGTATQVGAWINVPDLIIGEVYTASGYVYASTGVTDITISINPVTGFTYQVGEVVAVTSGTWQRVSVQFTATASAMNVGFWSTGSGTQTWFLDGVMLNPGGLTTYGDGATDLWNWESTPGSSRSYFYERGNIAYAAVQDVLSNHLPLGISAQEPVYNTPVTQYS